MVTPQVITMNQIIKMFKDFSDSHLLLNDFGFGPTSDIGQSVQMKYPYLWTTTRASSVISIANKTAIPTHSFTFLLVDQINIQENYTDVNGLDSDNQQEVVSDTLQTIQDFITYLGTLGQYGVKLIEQDISLDIVEDETTDKVTGWVFDIDLKITHVNCSYPTDGIAPIIPTSCPVAIVENSDGTYFVSVGSGGQLILPDITHTQTDGSPTTLPAQTPLVCTPGGTSGDGFVTSSNGRYNQSVPPETTVTLPDITHTDSDGSTTTLSAQTAFRATQCITLVDGILTINDEDGDTLHTVIVPNNADITQEIADSNITNSNGTFNDSVNAEGSKILPDITHTDSDGSSTVLPAQTGMVCTTVSAPLDVYYDRPSIINSTSFVTYDEGWLYANNYDPDYTLPSGTIYQRIDSSVNADYLCYNNSFGHKFRFTGLNGGYYDFNDSTYKDVDGVLSSFVIEFANPVGSSSTTDGYIIDNLTGIGWRSRRGGGINWATALNDVGISTLFSFTDWKTPTWGFMNTLIRVDVDNWLKSADRSPFQYDQIQQWTCTTLKWSTGNAWLGLANLATTYANKAANYNRTHSRIHFLRSEFVTQ
tara:strand:+ start:1870 stop:3642 length:1773 start_codon:yes stop_codon:yes gene_type:complete